MVTVSATAVAKLKDLMAQDGVEGQGLRVRVRGGRMLRIRVPACLRYPPGGGSDRRAGRSQGSDRSEEPTVPHRLGYRF